MPTPGSHAHDMKRSRLRHDLENQGAGDEDANKRANRLIADQTAGSSPAGRSERARGPLGEQGNGGDPGAVIDLRCPAFSDHATMPPRYTRAGENATPPLEWAPVPADTVELALLCEDRDAPTDKALHWLVTGIDPAVTELAEDQQPPGTTWPNAFGERGYSGPLPTVGDDPHRYMFRLYALDTPVAIEAGASYESIREALDNARIATGTVVGVYAR